MKLEITPEELHALLPTCRVYDTRTAVEFGFGSVDGAVNCSSEALLENPPEDRETPIVVLCSRGTFSVDTAEALLDMGYDAHSLKGGYGAWVRWKVAQTEYDEICDRAERSLHKKYAKSIWGNFIRAIKTYELLEEGDRVAVCISGGKDSMLMAKLFMELQKHSIFPFELRYIVMDPGYSPENRKAIEDNARRLKLPITIYDSNIFDSVFHVEKNPCYLCARMRRGHLYSYAKSLGCNKIALGHHYDDVIETILMGMLYGAQIQNMPPKLRSTSYPGMELIRPMYFIREADVKSWARYNDLHFIQCACRFTATCSMEGNNETKSKRQETKRLIQTLKATNPDVEAHIFRSVEHVHLDTMLGYKTGGKKVTFLEHYKEANPNDEP